MITVTVLVLLAALIAIIAEAIGKCPGWISKVLIWVVLALMVFPK